MFALDVDKVRQGFQDEFGRAPEVVARVPGRINLMGRHVDHQGGDVNMMAINKYVYVAIGKATRKGLVFRNGDQGLYEAFDCELEDARLDLSAHWSGFIERKDVAEFRDGLPLWCRYLVGAALRISLYGRQLVEGLDVYVHGDLPPDAGLSSSSALGLGFILGMAAMKGWSLNDEDLIRLSSEAEQFIGMRGGDSDQAAMLASRPGSIAHIGCLPFQVKGLHPFSPDYGILLANSHEPARKGAGARNEYNWRVGAYRIAAALLRSHGPEWCKRMEHLRDLDPRCLGITTAEIYRAVKLLPPSITRKELKERHPGEYAHLEVTFAAHEEPDGGYPLRDIILYGLAEMARSRRTHELLEREDYALLGRWITLSHDGDRISRNMNGERGSWRPPLFTDAWLESMAVASEKGDPRADLALQTGAYGCSTFRVDEMVDICTSVEGCLGAQILGAGLGGCTMTLARKEAIEEVRRRLVEQYYEPRELPPDAWDVYPGEGAQVLKHA